MEDDISVEEITLCDTPNTKTTDKKLPLFLSPYEYPVLLNACAKKLHALGYADFDGSYGKGLLKKADVVLRGGLMLEGIKGWVVKRRGVEYTLEEIVYPPDMLL